MATLTSFFTKLQFCFVFCFYIFVLNVSCSTVATQSPSYVCYLHINKHKIQIDIVELKNKTTLTHELASVC